MKQLMTKLKRVAVAALTMGLVLGAQAEDHDCITFASKASFTLHTADGFPGWDGSIYYSTDKSSWTKWDGEATLTAAQDSSTGEYRLYLYGEENARIANGGRWVLAPTDGNTIACRGDIETLRGATATEGPVTEMDDGCYLKMFKDCTALAEAPTLTATTLAERCYQQMFEGCTALTNAPALPATTLAESCYRQMFDGCTALTQAPALPAETLAESCYSEMFDDCTALTNAPALPAETLAKRCYALMFDGCTALTAAPALPAKALGEGCYNYMFWKCTSLTNAPALPAKTLADDCYCAMFSGCTSLTNAPALPAETLAENCYNSMFYGCTSLTNAPALPATTLADYCYQNMFEGCTALTKVPALPATQLNAFCYYAMFQGCKALVVNETAPGAKWSIPAGAVDISGMDMATGDMFSGTGGTFTGAPEVGKTYYVESDWKRAVDLGGGMTARDYYDGDWAIVGNGEVAAAQTAVLKSESITNLWIHTGVTGVGANAFTDSAFWTLRDVTLGAACTSVGDRAFKKCYGLTNVTSRATDASTVGAYAFSGCHSLQWLSFAGAATFDTGAYTFQTAIYMREGGIPEVYAVPTVTVAGKSERIMGKIKLTDKTWTDVTDFSDEWRKAYRFFMIEMK